MQISLLFVAAIASVARCQSLPSVPQDTHIVKSKIVEGASISYKETTICETTPGVKGYSGYVHLPASALVDIQPVVPYNVSMFFWFFEARHNAHRAPISIYLGGGPGETSLYGAIVENGPCIANPDGNSTTLNEWSWNNHVNMLYIDQPVQAGFSYDTLVTGNLDLFSQIFTPSDNFAAESNATNLAGVRPSQNINSTASTSAASARTLWHFSQVFFSDFPQFDVKHKTLSLWANSYGGFYAPSTLAYFQKQNEAVKQGNLPHNIYLPMGTMGITNGCIDSLYEMPAYPHMAFNNTYGLEAIPRDVYEAAVEAIYQPGGCQEQTLRCRELGAKEDPLELGNNDTVNEVCAAAFSFCFSQVQGVYAVSNRSVFDIAHTLPETFPPWYAVGYFSQRWVQEALGVPLNFTYNSDVVQSAFLGITGDAVRRTKADTEYLLKSGVKVAMVFGDRDYRCNWLGAENTSLHLDYADAPRFRSAGYSAIKVNSSYAGGLVRQHDNLSFSRVFEAGHSVSGYQPETVYQIFMRTIFGTDVATGKRRANHNYTTSGPVSSWDVKNVLPEPEAPKCNVWAISAACTEGQIEALRNGTAVVRDYNVISPVA